MTQAIQFVAREHTLTELPIQIVLAQFLENNFDMFEVLLWLFRMYLYFVWVEHAPIIEVIT
jgi:hypothetical protein